MRTIVLAAFVAVCIPAPARADVGPPKQWAAFPGRVVRAVSFRGERFGGEPSITVVQGRDGNVYLRGQFGLYRFRENGAEPPRVADTDACGSDAHGADSRPLVPVALCTRAQDIIVAAESWHRHLRVPYPDPAHPPYRFDGRALSDVVPAAGGGYWFAYGEKASVGRVWPSGRAALWRYPGLRPFYHIIAGRGDDVYAVDHACRVVRLRARAMVTVAPADDGCAWNSRRMVVTRDGAVWFLGDRSVERRTAAGTRSRWTLSMYADDMAATRDGTAYVLGSSARQWPSHAMIATIAPHGTPVVRRLPMPNAQSIAVDSRDRIWITNAYDHAAAMISPPGASR